MKTYLALVHKEADSAYGLSFPDLPGCFAAADSETDILQAGAEALELWFEDAAPVAPRGPEAIQSDAPGLATDFSYHGRQTSISPLPPW